MTNSKNKEYSFNNFCMPYLAYNMIQEKVISAIFATNSLLIFSKNRGSLNKKNIHELF